MNLSTMIIFSLIVIAIVLDIRYLMRKGVNQCGCGCKGCSKSCGSKKLKELRKS